MTSPGHTTDQLFLAFQQTLAGRYSIDRELGRGGMGIVYLAREVHLDRLVAIKLLPPDRAAQPGLRDRFLREARLAAKLSHPNIIPIHAVEDAAGFVFYVMAFIDGETLAHRVRARGPLSTSEGARVLREVAWALGYAHTQGLVHRDVKPDNILIETSSGRVLVADFGIASVVGDAHGEGVSGTPEFMSPEQVLGKALDARSDLYGLGATAFFAFSGRFPFEGSTPTEILAKQVTEPAPPLSSLGLAVPRKLAMIVDRCLAKDPDSRPASAESLADQLGAALEQRRELPAALRAFVKRDGRMDSGGTLVTSLLLLPVSALFAAVFGPSYGIVGFGIGVVVAPSIFLVTAARRLLMMGFAHQDLGPAFRAEAEVSREERTVPGLTAPGLLHRLLPSVARISAALFAVSGFARFGLALFRESWLANYTVYDQMRDRVAAWNIASGSVGTVMLASMATAMVAGAWYGAAEQVRRDIDTEFWGRLWTGRVGRAAFGIARELVGNRARQSAMTHRATELSLGMAAEQLYDGLPKDARQALGDLPAVLHRLQADAGALRKRHEELQEALGSGADGVENADLRELRDSIHAKLGEAVGALETIRLNLLRLHAGSATVESLTTHLGLAADVSEGVERLIAAHAEVERVMQFPRLAASTPV